MNIIGDIYYLKKYMALYLKENEEIFEFRYEREEKVFYNTAIKRAIKKIGKIEVNDGYYDLESAYGYGGIYTNTLEKGFIQEALNVYQAQCKQENIIAEFTRFHVFNEMSIRVQEFFDMDIHDRDVVYVDLSISDNERWKVYSSNVRNILRKCSKELTFSRSDDLTGFIELYRKTMDKNDADRFYYFSDEYFHCLFRMENVELYDVKYQGILLSSSFFMFSEDFCHYHLSANNYEYSKYNANYFMLDSIFDIARERGIRYCILGGGRTNSAEDNLLKFKQKFSSLSKPFYIAGKIYNEMVYRKYITLWESQASIDVKYFLKYRLEIK